MRWGEPRIRDPRFGGTLVIALLRATGETCARGQKYSYPFLIPTREPLF